MSAPHPGGRFVQFGCWKDAPENWENFDCSPYLVLDQSPLLGARIIKLFQRDWTPFPPNVRYGDIVKGLPIEAESCRAVYSSHVLEHLSLYELRKALTSVYNLLEPGGCFRAVLPDLEYLVDCYRFNETPDAAHDFMRSTGLGDVHRSRGWKGFLKEWFGGSRHRWMWDYASLEKECLDAGFQSVRRAVLGDSGIEQFAYVEKPERWQNCLGIECRKSVVRADCRGNR